MADALGTPSGVVSDEDHRLAIAAMLSAATSTPLTARTGVLTGPGSTTLITGTSATAPMTVNIAAHHWVTSRGTGDGVYLGTKEAAGTVDIAAAPASNSRIDVVYVKQNDASSTISPDGSTGELYGVATGTAAVSPTKPALPVGAVELGTVTVAAGATATNGAGVTIANTARQVSARGATIVVRNAAERDEITAYPAVVYRLDGDTFEYHGLSGAWKPLTPDTAWVAAVTTNTDYDYAVPSTWTTLTQMSVNVTVPAGRTMDVEWKAPRLNLGAAMGGQTRLLINGAQQDVADYSTGSGVSLYLPGRLSGSFLGTGASVAIAVQAQCPTGTMRVQGANLGPVLLRYRIN